MYSLNQRQTGYDRHCLRGNEMKKEFVLLIFIFLLISVSCNYQIKGLRQASVQVSTDGIDTESPSEFTFDSEEGVYSFSTDISDKESENGYTYWTVTGVNESTEFEEISFSIKKNTGTEISMFGILFAKEEHDGKAEFDMVLINTQAQYLVCHVSGQGITYYRELSGSAYLKQGFDKENIISISYDKDSLKYSIKFNSNDVFVFSDEREIEDFTGFGYGIVSTAFASDSQNENVVFEEIN